MEKPKVFVVHLMSITHTTTLGNQTVVRTFGPQSVWDFIDATFSRTTLLHAAEEIVEGGVKELQYAVQAPGNWHEDPRFRGEFYLVRQVTQDEIFVSCSRVLVLRPDEIVYITGAFGLDLFLHEHGREYDDAISLLQVKAHELLLETVGASYWECFGVAPPDKLVNVCWESLKTVDLTVADRNGILALVPSVVQQLQQHSLGWRLLYKLQKP